MDRYKLSSFGTKIEKPQEDALSKYRIKPLSASSDFPSSAPLSPREGERSLSDSARADEQELREVKSQLQSFNKQMREDVMAKYKVSSEAPDTQPTSTTSNSTSSGAEGERLVIEQQIRALLSRQHTLKLRRKERDAASLLSRFRVADPESSAASESTPSSSTSSTASSTSPPAQAPAAKPSISPTRTSPTVASTAQKPDMLDKYRSGSASSRQEEPTKITLSVAENMVMEAVRSSHAPAENGGVAKYKTPAPTSSPAVQSRGAESPAPKQAAAKPTSRASEAASHSNIRALAASAPSAKSTTSAEAEVLAAVRPVHKRQSPGESINKYRIAENAAPRPTTTEEETIDQLRRPTRHQMSSDISLNKYRIQSANDTPTVAVGVAPTTPEEAKLLEAIKCKPAVASAAATPDSLSKYRIATEEPSKRSAIQIMAEEENFLWNNLAKFAGDK